MSPSVSRSSALAAARERRGRRRVQCLLSHHSLPLVRPATWTPSGHQSVGNFLDPRPLGLWQAQKDEPSAR